MPHFNVNSGTSLYLLLALLFIVMNAFFVAAEFALVKIRKTRLQVLVGERNRLAKIALGMVDNLDAYLSATQLGITLASLGLGWIGEPAFAVLVKGFLSTFNLNITDNTLHSVAFMSAFLIISALHIILGELVPKSLAIRTTEYICLAVALPMRIFYYVFFPFLWMLNGTANVVLKLIRLPMPTGSSHAHSEEELKLVVEDSFVEGAIESDQRTLLNKAIDFGSKTIGDIMLPFDKVVFLDLSESLNENLTRARDAGHTRFPVLSIDKTILGFVHMKDIIWSLENHEVINLYDLIRPLITFRQQVNIDEALKQFRRKKIHMAMVKNQHDVIIGIVTMEDIIEELVGEIEDEFDEEAAKAN
ncbi:hemolysin family protein [bacterium]|nr:hemolysin family protein [bacterium]